MSIWASTLPVADIFDNDDPPYIYEASHILPELRGSRNGQAKLTETDIITIRSMAADGQTQQAIGDAYGIGQQTVSRIVNRQSWRHV